MSARSQALLWTAQRASAAVLALAVMVHLGTIVYAVRGGLSAAEIIARLQGNPGWLAFYTVFVAAAAVHTPLGLRTILAETTPLRGVVLDVLMLAFGFALAVLGWRAVLGLFAFSGQ